MFFSRLNSFYYSEKLQINLQHMILYIYRHVIFKTKNIFYIASIFLVFRNRYDCKHYHFFDITNAGFPKMNLYTQSSIATKQRNRGNVCLKLVRCMIMINLHNPLNVNSNIYLQIL